LPPQPQAAQPQAPAKAPPPAQPLPQPPAPQPAGAVDFHAVYTFHKVAPEERDRVHRAQELLAHLPGKASHTKEVVEATLRAFGVDAGKIVDAANKQLLALEGFIRSSQDQAQRVLDESAQRIAELEAEIERCRQIQARATHEQEERARTVNGEMVKVQRVLEFFGQDVDVSDIVESGEPEDPTEVGAARAKRRPAPRV
jgi:hypothetical protein